MGLQPRTLFSPRKQCTSGWLFHTRNLRFYRFTGKEYSDQFLWSDLTPVMLSCLVSLQRDPSLARDTRHFLRRIWGFCWLSERDKKWAERGGVLQRIGYFQMRFSRSCIWRHQLYSDSHFKCVLACRALTSTEVRGSVPQRIYLLNLSKFQNGPRGPLWMLNRNGPTPQPSLFPFMKCSYITIPFHPHSGCQSIWGEGRAIRICIRTQGQ